MTFYVPMVDDTGEVFTFSTTSRGGKNAVADILRHYSRNRNANPGKYPVMALESDVYQHSNAQYGRIKYPVFRLGRSGCVLEGRRRRGTGSRRG